MLDASGSIGTTNYEQAKGFSDKLTAAYLVQSTSRVGFITFSDTATAVVPLDNTLSDADISAAILGASYEAGVTYTNLGIDAAVDEFTNSPRAVPRNIVVLTDGASTDHSATLLSAGDAANDGIRVFTVGIGSSIDQQELVDIADENQNRVYNTGNFDDLIQLLNPLSQALCAN